MPGRIFGKEVFGPRADRARQLQLLENAEHTRAMIKLQLPISDLESYARRFSRVNTELNAIAEAAWETRPREQTKLDDAKPRIYRLARRWQLPSILITDVDGSSRTPELVTIYHDDADHELRPLDRDFAWLQYHPLVRRGYIKSLYFWSERLGQWRIIVEASGAVRHFNLIFALCDGDMRRTMIVRNCGGFVANYAGATNDGRAYFPVCDADNGQLDSETDSIEGDEHTPDSAGDSSSSQDRQQSDESDENMSEDPDHDDGDQHLTDDDDYPGDDANGVKSNFTSSSGSSTTSVDDDDEHDEDDENNDVLSSSTDPFDRRIITGDVMTDEDRHVECLHDCECNQMLCKTGWFTPDFLPEDWSTIYELALHTILPAFRQAGLESQGPVLPSQWATGPGRSAIVELIATPHSERTLLMNIIYRVIQAAYAAFDNDAITDGYFTLYEPRRSPRQYGTHWRIVHTLIETVRREIHYDDARDVEYALKEGVRPYSPWLGSQESLQYDPHEFESDDVSQVSEAGIPDTAEDVYHAYYLDSDDSAAYNPGHYRPTSPIRSENDLTPLENTYRPSRAERLRSTWSLPADFQDLPNQEPLHFALPEWELLRDANPLIPPDDRAPSLPRYDLGDARYPLIRSALARIENDISSPFWERFIADRAPVPELETDFADVVRNHSADPDSYEKFTFLPVSGLSRVDADWDRDGEASPRMRDPVVDQDGDVEMVDSPEWREGEYGSSSGEEEEDPGVLYKDPDDGLYAEPENDLYEDPSDDSYEDPEDDSGDDTS